METVEINEAETYLSQQTERRPLGLLKGLVRVSEDFDAPLPCGGMNVPDADCAGMQFSLKRRQTGPVYSPRAG